MVFRIIPGAMLALTMTPALASETVQVDHEASIGFADVRDVDDNFVGVGYRYFLDSVSIDDQPWSISPYLQRTNSVSVDYFGINDLDIINVNGEWFYSDSLVLRGRYGRTTVDSLNWDETLQRVGIDVSTFANENWEYGIGFDYYDYEETDLNTIVTTTISDNEASVSVFARYTSFGVQKRSFTPGWDIQARATYFDDELSVELDADYFLRANWSLGVSAIHESDDRFGSDNIVELGTDYWFNPYSSIKFGLGFDVDDSTLGSATLLGTFRF